MTKAVAVVALALTVVTFGFAPTAAADSSTTFVTISASVLGPVTSPCTGEVLTFDGTIRVLIHSTTDAAGGTLFVFEFNLANVRATDTSGTEYQVTGGLSNQNNTLAGGSIDFTDLGVLNIISPGSTANLIEVAGIHVTFNANGDLTAGVAISGGPDCVG